MIYLSHEIKYSYDPEYLQITKIDDEHIDIRFTPKMMEIINHVESVLIFKKLPKDEKLKILTKSLEDIK